MLRNLIWDHPTSPEYLSTFHKNYKVDRTAGSSRIHEARSEIDVFDNPKMPNDFRNRLMIYRHDRIEISNLTSQSISRLYDPNSDTRRHRTTCIDFGSTIFKLHQCSNKLHIRTTHEILSNFKTWTYPKFRQEVAGIRKNSPAATLSPPPPCSAVIRAEPLPKTCSPSFPLSNATGPEPIWCRSRRA